MDTAQFLARILPPGTYIAVSYERRGGGGQDKHFEHAFYAGTDYTSAADLLHWAAGKGFNAYHANASFKLAAPAGQTLKGAAKFAGKRKIDNAQNLKTFWLDLDVKREGDKKKSENCYGSIKEAVQWAGEFVRAASLSKPNLVVCSGYGVHVYWVLTDAVPTEEWQRYAQGLKAAMGAHGFRGDSGLTSNAACLLRPPGTTNFKDPADPKPVYVLGQGPDLANATMLTALDPWVAKAGVVTPVVSAAALAGGQVSTVFQQQRAASMGVTGTAGPGAGMAAAGMLLPDGPPKSFALIAQQCKQVAHSLATHGEDEHRGIWYLGHLTLAHFCHDGADFVHPISDGDKRYSAAETDKMVAQVAKEAATKGIGAPTCEHYEKQRPALCQACPHHKKINSPAALGIPQADPNNTDLPANYRRNIQLEQIEERVVDASGDLRWVLVLRGDATEPGLHEVGRGKALSFVYTRAGQARGVFIPIANLVDDASRVRIFFDSQGIVTPKGSEKRLKDFVMAWINQLIDKRAKHSTRAEPWGWSEDEHGKLDGFAVGGRLYRPDGSIVSVVADDQGLEQIYKPRGTLAKWQEAQRLVCAGKAEHQVIVASAFAAPLVKLTGHSGVIVSAWSTESGVGKTSAMTVAQGVWSSPKAQYALNDTTNFTLARIAMARAMPAIWDEARTNSPEQARAFVQMLFQLTQGKERGRMKADTSLHHVRLWETMLVCAANRPLMDLVLATEDSAEAGAVRVFEFPITQPKMATDPNAQDVIALAKDNYGRAGETYAAWLATNHATAHQAIKYVSMDFSTALGSDSSERFYIAGMASLYVGAKIAKKLGLAEFDLPLLHTFLCDTFRKLRAARQRDVVLSSTGYDIHEVLARFMSSYNGRKLVTEKFNGPGKGSTVEVKLQPYDDREGIVVQVSQADIAMRVVRHMFYEWLRKRSYPVQTVIDQMAAQWGAKLTKVTIGGGTRYSLGQVQVVEIPLADHSLQSYAVVGAKDIGPLAGELDNPSAPPPMAGGLRRNGLPTVNPPT